MWRFVSNPASEHASRAHGSACRVADKFATDRRPPTRLCVVRLMVAAVLGLVLQLGAALPALGCGPLAVVAAAAPAGEHSCCCCADADSCPCLAKSENNEHPNAPATLPEREAAVSMVPAQAAVAEPFAPAAGPQVAAHGAAPARSFPGVTLAVAFCRWII